MFFLCPWKTTCPQIPVGTCHFHLSFSHFVFHAAWQYCQLASFVLQPSMQRPVPSFPPWPSYKSSQHGEQQQNSPILFTAYFLLLFSFDRFLKMSFVVLDSDTLYTSFSFRPSFSIFNCLAFLFWQGRQLLFTCGKLCESLCRVRCSLELSSLFACRTSKSRESNISKGTIMITGGTRRRRPR